MKTVAAPPKQHKAAELYRCHLHSLNCSRATEQIKNYSGFNLACL